MNDEIDDLKEMIITIILGFSSLICSVITIISIKSGIGVLTIVHDNIEFFMFLSLILFLSTVIFNKKNELKREKEHEENRKRLLSLKKK